MRKELKVGEYVIFDRNGKKTGKAKIHGFVLIDGILHAVFTYYIDGVIKHIRTLPVEIEENADAIHFGGAGCYLTADAPVLPKPVKFQVGKVYRYQTSGGSFLSYTVTAKYTDGGTTYIVVDNSDVLKVGKIEIDNDVVEYVDFPVGGLLANETVKEIEE